MVSPASIKRNVTSLQLELTCNRNIYPTIPQFNRISLLMPLCKSFDPLRTKCLTGPFVHLGYETYEMPVNFTQKQSRPFQSEVTSSYRYKLRALSRRRNRSVYGHENLYGGSCLQVADRHLFYTGNSGKLRVAELRKDESEVFFRVPGEETSVGCKRLDFERIYCIQLNKYPVRIGGLCVGARFQWGASIYNIDFNQDEISVVQSFPCPEGLVSSTFIPFNLMSCLNRIGEVTEWDIESGAHTVCTRVDDMLDGVYLEWEWGMLQPGFHPKTVLVGGREKLFLVDLRCGKLQKINLDLTSYDHIRSIDSETSGPYTFTCTDDYLLLSDIRQPLRPIYSLKHGRGVRGPVTGMRRLRFDGQDWIGVQDKWGDQSMCALDWSHSYCDEWSNGKVNLTCSGRGPAVVGGFKGLGSWKDTVVRGRDLGGEWLDFSVEDRCGIPFTGMDMKREEDGSTILYAVNAIGDLFGKILSHKKDVEDSSTIDMDGVETQEDTWLKIWGESVAECSLMPKVMLLANLEDRDKCTSTLKKKKIHLPISFREYRYRKKYECKKCRIDFDFLDKISYIQVKSLPPLLSVHWRKDLYEWAYSRSATGEQILDKNVRKLKIDDAVSILSRHRDFMIGSGSGLQRDKSDKSRLNLEFYKCSLTKSRSKRGVNVRWFSNILKKLNIAASGDLEYHFLPIFKVLKLYRYSPGTKYRYSNRHSESILQILSKDSFEISDEAASEKKSKLHEVDSASSQKVTEQSLMDDFWADLGVDITAVGSQVNDNITCEDN